MGLGLGVGLELRCTEQQLLAVEAALQLDDLSGLGVGLGLEFGFGLGLGLGLMAMSHRLEPRERRLEKDSWPGVSMIMSPGMCSVPEPGVTCSGLG